MSNTNFTESYVPSLNGYLEDAVLAARNGDWSRAQRFFEYACSQECSPSEENAAREAWFQAYEFSAQLEIIAIDRNLLARISDEAFEQRKALPMMPAAEPLLLAVSKWCQQKDRTYLEMKIQRLIDTAPESPQSFKIFADIVLFAAMVLTFPIRMVEKLFSRSSPEPTPPYIHAAHA